MDPLTEEQRVAQGGLGYLQYHAAITWMRALAQYGLENHATACEGVGNPTFVAPVVWKYPAHWATFDFASMGHLLISLDEGKTWYGLDATFYPPNEDGWDRMMRRVKALQDHPDRFKPIKLRAR